MNTIKEFISKSFGDKKTLVFVYEDEKVRELDYEQEISATEFFLLFGFTSISDEELSKKKNILRTVIEKIKFSENFYQCGFESHRKKVLLLIDFENSKLGGRTKEKLSLACETLKELIELKEESIATIPQNFYLPFFIYDAEKKEFVFETQGFDNLLGFPASNWTKNKLSLLRKVNVNDLRKIKHFFKQTTQCKEAYVDFQIKDNFSNKRYLRLFISPDNTNCKKFVGLLLDITNEINLKNRIEISNAKFRALLEISNDFIFSLNRSGYLMLVNDDGARQLGFKTENLIGKHFLEIIAESDKSSVALAFRKIIKSNDAITFDAKIVNAFSEEIPFSFTATSLKSGNEITGVIGFGKNFKSIFDCNKRLMKLNEAKKEIERLLKLERERAKEQIMELKELNQAKDQFISTVSHELRTPLTSIIGFAETLVEDTSLPGETVSEYSKIILDEGKRLTSLIDNILDLTKLEEGNITLNYEEFDLADLLKILLGNYVHIAKNKNIEIESIIPEAEFKVYGDMRRLEKAFSNVISNAIKFTNPGGKVTVKINNFLNEYAVIIKDTGIGIPREYLKNLFTKFQKISKPGKHVPGAGLGLAIAKKIIDLHKGSINITSEENVGTTVTVILPKKRG